MFERGVREYHFFEPPIMSLKLQEFHSYHSLIPQENHSNNNEHTQSRHDEPQETRSSRKIDLWQH